MRQTSAICLAVIALLAGCNRSAEPDASAAPPADSLPPEDPTAASLQSFADRVPDSARFRRGACPFECCRYGEWAVENGAPVRTRPDSTAPLAFSLGTRERFRADSGFVRITDLLLIVVSDTVDQRPSGKLIVPGDTLVVLDHLGEGHYNVWRNGDLFPVQGFWGAEAPRNISEMIGHYDSEWWVHVTSRRRENGWLLVKPPMRVFGADQCAGPR